MGGGGAGNVGSDNTTGELTIKTTIISLAPTNLTSTGFTARWSQAEDVANYTLEVSDVSDFSTLLPGYDPLVVAADQTSTAVTGLDFGTSYYYRVRFTNTGAEESGNSNTVALKTAIDAATLADSTA